MALSRAGVPLSTIQWIGENEFRYAYWQQLPAEAQWALLPHVEEEVYEDWDGDSGGRPIIFSRYSYKIRTNTTQHEQ